MAVSLIPKGFIGLSTDKRPQTASANVSSRSAGYVPPPRTGDHFVETDTGNTYVHVGGDNWELTP
jgi:hypothetical protein